MRLSSAGGLYQKHHTYEDTVVTKGTIEYGYREWPAVINGIPCPVASAADVVWNDGFLSGEFLKLYYRVDTDYDYFLLAQIVADKQPGWKLCDSEDIFARYNINSVLSVESPYSQSSRLTDGELEVFWQECLEIDKLSHTYPVNDRLYFEIHAPGKYYDAQSNAYYLDPDRCIYVTDFSNEG